MRRIHISRCKIHSAGARYTPPVQDTLSALTDDLLLLLNAPHPALQEGEEAFHGASWRAHRDHLQAPVHHEVEMLAWLAPLKGNGLAIPHD